MRSRDGTPLPNRQDRGSKKSPVHPADILSRVRASGIEVQPLTERHLDTLAALPLYDDHRAPNDRLIIAQAIADRVPLVSSDRKFARYVRHGLDFIFNER